jgi:hypothetical protein
VSNMDYIFMLLSVYLSFICLSYQMSNMYCIFMLLSVYLSVLSVSEQSACLLVYLSVRVE